MLLDESLPRQLVAELPGHEVETVRGRNWNGLRNGVLLRAARDGGFDVLITADSSMRFQQNVERIQIAVIVLRHVRNRLKDLRPLVPDIMRAIETITPGEIREITYGASR